MFLTAMVKHQLKLEEISGKQYNNVGELQKVLLPRLAKILADVIRRGLEQKKLKVEMNKVVFDRE